LPGWGLTSAFTMIRDNRELIRELAVREIREKYIRSVAGLAWLVIYPACLLSVYLIVFGLIFRMRADLTGLGLNVGYTAFLITGYIPWLGAAETLSRAPLAISSNGSLIRQFVFPREILPLKVVLVSLTPQLVLLVLSLGYLLLDSQGRALSLLWLALPVLLFFQFLLLCGLSWIFSATGLYVGDIKEAVKLLVLMGPFLAPVFYSLDQVPAWMGRLLHLNPFTLLINCFRDALLAGRVDHPLSWLLIGPVCLAFFWIGDRVFKRLKPGFGDLL
jgi:lipopolysaccharide transport system permease protein